MRLRFGAAIAPLIVACGSFEATNDPASAAGSGADAAVEGGPSVDAGSDSATPKTGCAAALGPFIFCSDFDASNEVEQLTVGLGKSWEQQTSGGSQISIFGGQGVSSTNGLLVSGEGSAPFVAQVHLAGVPIAKNVIHLKMKVFVRALPTGNDVYIAGLNFTNITFGLALHANGTVGLAQTPIPGSLDKSATATGALDAGDWTAIELYVNRNTGTTEVAAKARGIGTATTLAAVPMGDAEVTIGMGYCDVDCGTPSVAYDDVVLSEE